MELASGLKQTELGPLPADWDVLQIKDLKPFVTSGSRGWAAYYAERGAAFIRISNLSRGCIYPDLDDLRFVNVPAGNSEAERTQLKDGDVLISITADIGIIGYVTAEVPKPAYINQHIALLRFDSETTCPQYVAYFLASERPQKLFRFLTDSGAKAGMNLTTVQQVRLAVPSEKREQEAIAQALSDADALIASLERLLAKKRDIKQGVMQELLTGKRRLPGFTEGWTVARLGSIAHIKTGTRNNQDQVEGGQYPFFVRSPKVERINTYSYDCEAILVPGEGNIGKIFHYINGRFDVHQRVYAITRFSPETSGRFVFYYMAEKFGSHALQNSVKATVDSLRLPTFLDFEMVIPRDKDEQDAIADVISDVDAEIASLELRLAKARLLKTAVAQELLTGRIRLK